MRGAHRHRYGSWSRAKWTIASGYGVAVAWRRHTSQDQPVGIDIVGEHPAHSILADTETAKRAGHGFQRGRP